MYRLEKRTQFDTVGELIALLELLPEDTPVSICGDNYCFYHEEQDGSAICLDCEELSECYEEERTEDE